MDDILNNVDQIKSKEDFVKFIFYLISDYKKNPTDWGNIDLGSYLESIAAWTDDIEGFYQNWNLKMPENITWSVFAHVLIAAKMYE